MPKRTMETLDSETRASEGGIRERITDFLRKKVTDPGILAVLVAREERMLIAMFTYNLTTIVKPSDHAVDVALNRLAGNDEYKKLNDRDKFFTLQSMACGIDNSNRKFAGGTIVQAIMSCAAGLDTIMYSDDRKLESKETSKKLNWNRQSRQSAGNMKITTRVSAAIGYVGGIDNTAMETFDPDVFERDFLEKIGDKVPELHFVENLNKIVFYDVEQTDTLDDVAPITTYTTTEVTLPDFPLPPF